MTRLGRVTAAALIMSGIHGAMAAQVPAPVRIGVPEAGNIQYLSLWVAIGGGYFADEGLDARVVHPATNRQTPDLLLSGQVEMALLPPPMYLGLIAEQRPVVLFANLLANDPINLVVRPDVAARLPVTPASPLADRIKALKGLRIGVANEPPRRLRVLLGAGGLNADDIDMVIVQGEQQIAALTSGRVDALYTHTPYLEDAIVSHGGVILINQSAGEVAEVANGQIHSLAATRRYAEAHPGVLRAATRAIARAQSVLRSDPAAAAAALRKAGMTPPSGRHLETIVRLYAPAVPLTPAVSADAVERNVTLYPARPAHPDFSRVRAADFVDPSFATPAPPWR